MTRVVLISSAMRFFSAFLIGSLLSLLPVLGQARPIDGRSVWGLGVMLGIPTILSVCLDKYPEFNSQNINAYNASPYYRSSLDALLAQPRTIQIEDVSLKELVDAHHAARAIAESSTAERLRTACEQFPAFLEKQTLLGAGLTTEALKQRLQQVEGDSAAPTDSQSARRAIAPEENPVLRHSFPDRLLTPDPPLIASEKKTVAPRRAPTPVRNSNSPRIEGLAIKPGDSLENVRTATRNYFDRKFDGKNWYLEPFGDGTYVYFDASDRVEIIRLLSGAQTTIGGLPVRGSFSRILARLGPPDVTEALPGGQTEAEIYYLDQDTAAIFYKSEPSGFIAETRIVSNKSHPPRTKWPDLSVEQ